MDSSTERRDDDATTCEACEKAYSKYSCPKCGAKLCALACYERHNDGRCRSAFHENGRARAMRGLTATSETRTAMMESLKRQAFADGTLDLASASEGEGEGEEEDEEGDGDGTAAVRAEREEFRSPASRGRTGPGEVERGGTREPSSARSRAASS